MSMHPLIRMSVIWVTGCGKKSMFFPGMNFKITEWVADSASTTVN